MKTAIIVNPVAGNGKNKKMWGEIRDEVKSRIGELVEYNTSNIGDATRLAKEIALLNDIDLLIVAGGDGTLNEVVNGLINEKNEAVNPKIKLAVLSAGRGCDFARTLEAPDNYRQVVDMLIQPQTKAVDVGCGFLKDQFGRKQRRLFINMASVGLSGRVVEIVGHTSKFLPPEAAYFTSVAATFLTTKPPKLKVFADEKMVFEGNALNVFVANGKFSGAGMCWAPDAKIDDGLFDVVVVENIPKYKLLSAAQKLYNRKFLSMPGVYSYRAKSILVEGVSEVPIEMDGEQPGVTPFACTMLPQMLNFVVA